MTYFLIDSVVLLGDNTCVFCVSLWSTLVESLPREGHESTAQKASQREQYLRTHPNQSLRRSIVPSSIPNRTPAPRSSRHFTSITEQNNAVYRSHQAHGVVDVAVSRQRCQQQHANRNGDSDSDNNNNNNNNRRGDDERPQDALWSPLQLPGPRRKHRFQLAHEGYPRFGPGCGVSLLPIGIDRAFLWCYDRSNTITPTSNSNSNR